jgi:hypothetical protein
MPVTATWHTAQNYGFACVSSDSAGSFSLENADLKKQFFGIGKDTGM